MKKSIEELALNRPASQNKIIFLFQQIKKVRIMDICALFMLFVSFIPGKVWKLCNRDIWVVSEYEYLARDNGYWFFKYLRDNYPEKYVFYPIAKGCSDAKRISDLGNMVSFGSFIHFMLFWAANKQFTSSKNAGFPSRICEDLVQWNFHRFEYILLNHGLTRGKSPVVDPLKTNFDFICTCSDYDKKIIVDDNGQPENKVIVTGFARHDSLIIGQRKEVKTIILMPTWRVWLNIKYARTSEQKKEVTQRFMNSKYYKSFQGLINNKSLIAYLEARNINLIFYLHDYVHLFKKYFDSNSKNVKIVDIDDADIQELLKQGSLLITDYSSVCYDFAYMEKPVLYFQFDLKEFENYQYAAGNNFSYEADGLGEICYDVDSLIEKVISYDSNGYMMPDIYKKRSAAFFKYKDNSNCERIFSRFK